MVGVLQSSTAEHVPAICRTDDRLRIQHASSAIRRHSKPAPEAATWGRSNIDQVALPSCCSWMACREMSNNFALPAKYRSIRHSSSTFSAIWK